MWLKEMTPRRSGPHAARWPSLVQGWKYGISADLRAIQDAKDWRRTGKALDCKVASHLHSAVARSHHYANVAEVCLATVAYWVAIDGLTRP